MVRGLVREEEVAYRAAAQLQQLGELALFRRRVWRHVDEAVLGKEVLTVAGGTGRHLLQPAHLRDTRDGSMTRLVTAQWHKCDGSTVRIWQQLE